MILYQQLPIQKNTQAEKRDKGWQTKCIDAIVGLSLNTTFIKKTTQQHKQINYNLIAGEVDYSNFTWVTDPYMINEMFGGQPAQLKCIPLIQTKINQLLGEELKRKFKYRAICINGKGYETREQKKLEYLQNYFRDKVYKELGIDKNNLPEDFKEPQQILDFFNYKYEDLSEITANRLLKQLERDLNLRWVFNQGMKDVFAVSEEIYRVTKKNDKPFVRNVDTRFFFCYKSDESPYIEDGYLYKEERRMTPAAIIDEYSEYLTEDELDRLNTFLNNATFLFPATSSLFDTQLYSNGFVNNGTRLVKDTVNTFQVYETVWASQQKIGYLTYYDEFDNKRVQVITDENFKLSKEQKKDPRNKLKWQWITQWWQGTRIGNLTTYIDINVKPCDVQMCPYIGAVHNSLNSKPTSLVDYLKPVQFLYDQVYYRFENELSKAKGKKFLMDVAQLPKDMSMEKWMYHFENGSVIFINSAQEGNEALRTQFNQFTSIDLTISANIQAYIQYMDKLERLMDKISGITPQREGTPTPYGSNELYQNATANSLNASEPYFYLHDIVKRNVLSYLVEFSKYCYQNKQSEKAFLNGDLLKELIEFDSKDLHGSDIGVFIQDMQQDEEIFTFIKQNAQAAMASGSATIAEIVNILKSGSIVEGTNVLMEAAKRKQEIEQAQQQQQIALEKEKLDREENNRINNEKFELLKQDKDIAAKERLKQMEIGAKLSAETGTPTYGEIQANTLKEKEIDNKNLLSQQENLIKQQESQNKVILDSEKLNIERQKIQADMYIATVNKNQYDSPKTKLKPKKVKKSNK